MSDWLQNLDTLVREGHVRTSVGGNHIQELLWDNAPELITAANQWLGLMGQKGSLLALLRRVEWSDGARWCPVCAECENDGHELDCELAKALG